MLLRFLQDDFEMHSAFMYSIVVGGGSASLGATGPASGCFFSGRVLVGKAASWARLTTFGPENFLFGDFW